MDDLLILFREEAREHLDTLTRNLLALEKNPRDTATLKHCLRLAHTLKGMGRVVNQTRVADMAHTLEDALAPLSEGLDIESAYISDLLVMIESMREHVEAIAQKPLSNAANPASANSTSASPRRTTDALETVRIDIAEMDALLEGLSEATIQLGPLEEVREALRQMSLMALSLQQSLYATDAVDPATLLRIRAAADALHAMLARTERNIAPSLSRLEFELDNVHMRASTFRLLPAGMILGTLELCVRDAAESLGKSVNFSATGVDVKLEAHILLAIRDALVHVVRNAVDHGIESESERIAQGKPAVGQIQLDIVRRGRRVMFSCRDDGRGVDIDVVRQAAINKGRLSAAQAAVLDRQALLESLFEGGLSTMTTVTEMSGRGVGLDVVRTIANRFRGEASIHSTMGRGTEINIEVPVSLSAISVLSVTVDTTTILLPVDIVRGTLRMSPSDIIKTPDGEIIRYEGRAIPYVSLGTIMGLSNAVQAAMSALVVVESNSKWVAVGVDKVYRTMDVVVKPLPPWMDTSRAYMGAAFDSHGDPLLVVDPAEFVISRRHTAPSPAPSAQPAPPRFPILVVDDSLTTRMLEQSILEAAGYSVDLCASAEDALQRARLRTYGLFIVDVEMPGMSGFEFTRVTRADPKLRNVPVILVTSLSGAEDRRRGAEAGAAHYIVKGDFDQTNFVRKVAELMDRR